MRVIEMAGKASRTALLALAVAFQGTAGAQAMMKADPGGQGRDGPAPGASMQGPAAAQPQASLAGTISAISGSTVFVTVPDGGAGSFAVGAGTLILGRKPATLDSIRPGEALGVAATRGSDGSLTATAINVFPDALWQRARKGQFPMADGQVMTNAQVEKVAAAPNGRRLFLKYEMLAASIAVPYGAEIRRSTAISLSSLAIGQKVSARGSPGAGGILEAAFVTVDLPPG